MKFRKLFHLTGCLVLIAGLWATLYAEKPIGTKKDQKLAKGQANDLYEPMLINNIMNYYSNTGDGSLNPYTADAEGFELPIGSYGYVIFEDGLVYGGYHNVAGTPTLKIGGSTYWHGYEAGPIVTNGTNGSGMVGDNPNAAGVGGRDKYRLFKVRPDINPTTTETDVMAALQTEQTYRVRYESGITIDDIYNEYVNDWNEWPAAQGAPYTDVNGNGVYDPGTDIPGVPGADCTMWHIMNDSDPTRAYNFGGCLPMGMEVQRTIWAYNQSGALGNTIFIKYKMINKSGAKVDTMYTTQWADPDLGGALGYNDDFVGCDTTRSLGYVYNGEPVDGFYGRAVPAGGFCFFQGPVVPGVASDSAIFNGQVIHGKKNLHMSGFNFFINGSTTYTDPVHNDPRATIQWYHLMQGKVTVSGVPFINPVTGLQTTFLLSGDPVAGTGWLDGQLPGTGPNDRRMCLTAGPFTFQPADTQEVVVAALAAQANDRLSSITFLRFYTDHAQAAYNNFFVVPSPPAQPSVSVAALDKEIILSWGDATSVNKVENATEKLGYTFQGYNIYQLPSASFSNAKKLATYDVVDGVTSVVDNDFDLSTGTVIPKELQSGSDSGIKRFFDTQTDIFTNAPLINGTKYFFAVTAYNYNAAYSPKSLESAPIIITVQPQQPNPGTAYNTKPGATLTTDTSLVKIVGGSTDGYVVMTTVDPTKITG
ncbi:MAG TPA: hypothetical protein VMM57_10440, partial [Bacteroidota bacterium]|nr:hypothetical protein [Bacteroidota bacterium]